MEANIKNKPTLKSSEPVSLHHRILNEVQENIVSGKWQPGFRIPNETAMAEEYGCSRMTVNKALTQLTRAGLLVRTRKGGTRVKAPKSLSAALEITNIEKEVEDAGKEYSYRLLSDEVREPTPNDVKHFNGMKSDKIRELTCLHCANGRPFCFEERIINMDAVPEIVDVTFEKLAPGAWLLQKVPWNTAEHQITACLATDIVADILGIA
ncbi:MAG: histidine utilization repressor, partial [Hyphomicrobiales bacterium]